MTTRSYTVHIYEEEAALISKWTLQYPKIETGGDFFGLWLNEREVVIQAVLGPGKHSRRTTTSFFQDEEYLSNVGGLLTQNEGLCNVGSWHSHHTMNLSEPSRGDRDTVWRHLPTPGRFLLLIATIATRRDGPRVVMSFYLFESSDKGNKVTRMGCKTLEGVSPVRRNEAVSNELRKGAESPKAKNRTSSRAMTDSRPERVAGQQRSREQSRRPMQRGRGDREYLRNRQSNDQNYSSIQVRDGNAVRCDGGQSYYAYRNCYIERTPSRHPRQTGYVKPMFSFRDCTDENGRRGIQIFHEDHPPHPPHPLGACEVCQHLRIERQDDGRVELVKSVPFVRQESYGHYTCCIIL